MKKSILNLKGAQELSKNEQKAVNGGRPPRLPYGAVCTQYGNSGCMSGKCEMTISNVAYCI